VACGGEPADLRSVSGIIADARGLQSRGLIQLSLLLLVATRSGGTGGVFGLRLCSTAGLYVYRVDTDRTRGARSQSSWRLARMPFARGDHQQVSFG
jgi:hypothetical protein